MHQHAWSVSNTLMGFALMALIASGGCSGSDAGNVSTGVTGPVDWCAVPCGSDLDCPRTHVCVPTVVDGELSGVCGGEPCAISACACGDQNCDASCGETLDNCPCDCAVVGDEICSPCENPVTAPEDCCGGCGDGLCVGFGCGENPDTCPQDCGTACGNGICEAPESADNCPEDCQPFVCGNGVCEPTDGGPDGCPGDCNEFCGNCVCDADRGETLTDCPIDCGSCGDGVCSACLVLNENFETCPEDCCASRQEICNGMDDNCNGEVDEEDAFGCFARFADRDGDGFGDPDDAFCGCTVQAPYTATTGDDCDDTRADIHPAASETCNGVDDNCVNGVDEGFGVGGACDHPDPCQRGTLLCSATYNTPTCLASQPEADGVQCAPSRCGDGNVLLGHGQCDGAGGCQLGASIDCVEGCVEADGLATCVGSCTTDSDCAAGTFCQNNLCPGLFALGESCERDGACASGFCADGVCCDDACNGDCRSCSQGTCQLAANNTDPDGDCSLCRACNASGECALVEDGADPLSDCTATGVCGKDGMCDGAGACRDTPEGTECSPATCIETLFFPARECQGGTCVSPLPPSDCGNTYCDDTGTACALACATNVDCQPGSVCRVGVPGGMPACLSALQQGQACESESECESGHCVDGFCCNNACAGLCRTCGESPGNCIQRPVGQSDPGTCEAPDSCDIDGDCQDDVTNAKLAVQNDCCIASAATVPGCSEVAVESAVCATEPSCCELNWSAECVTLASVLGACP